MPPTEYASDSVSVFAAGEVTPLPSTSGAFALSAGARWHRRHLAIEARLGGGFAFSAVANGGAYVGRAGASVGIALPITGRVVTIPMLAYDAFVLAQPGDPNSIIVHRATIELPVAILLYRHVALEPFVQGGIAWINGGRDIAVVAGPRISIVL